MPPEAAKQALTLPSRSARRCCVVGGRHLSHHRADGRSGVRGADPAREQRARQSLHQHEHTPGLRRHPRGAPKRMVGHGGRHDHLQGQMEDNHRQWVDSGSINHSTDASHRSCKITGLTQGTEHSVVVEACNANGCALERVRPLDVGSGAVVVEACNANDAPCWGWDNYQQASPRRRGSMQRQRMRRLVVCDPVLWRFMRSGAPISWRNTPSVRIVGRRCRAVLSARRRGRRCGRRG